MTATSQSLTTDELAGVAFRKSRHSDSGGDGSACVEVGPLADGSGRVAVRDSKVSDSPILVYTREEWAAFQAGVRDGEFDF